MPFATGFQKFACEGDTITCDVDGFTVTARIVRDDCTDKPDERDEGFWPSRDKDAAGYVLPENYDSEMEKAKRAMAAWESDEWFYCGISLSVSRNDIVLDAHAASLWGIECNYPDSDNSYLTETANELLDEAVASGKAILRKLCS